MHVDILTSSFGLSSCLLEDVCIPLAVPPTAIKR